MQNLDLDSKLLKPLKEKLEKLEKSIETLTKNAIFTGKESEITLKISISVNKKENEDYEEYLEPNYEYQVTEKIKEAKGSYKGHLGLNYQVEIDEKNNITKVKEINEQTTLFEEDNK